MEGNFKRQQTEACPSKKGKTVNLGENGKLEGEKGKSETLGENGKLAGGKSKLGRKVINWPIYHYPPRVRKTQVFWALFRKLRSQKNSKIFS